MQVASPVRRRSLETSAFLPLLLGLALVALATGGGCDDEKKITPPTLDPDYLEQSSAVNVLANLKTSYEKRSYAQYEKLFATDYIFAFDPADVGDPINPTPPQWARADELASAQNLFTNARVYDISLDWSVGDLQPDSASGWKIRVDDVLLDVTWRNELNEVWIYQVKGATHVFYFREENTTTMFGHKKWTCTRWEDSPIGLARWNAGEQGPAVKRTTWGQIKAHYR